jgi:regulator of replication initiation timing
MWLLPFVLILSAMGQTQPVNLEVFSEPPTPKVCHSRVNIAADMLEASDSTAYFTIANGLDECLLAGRTLLVPADVRKAAIASSRFHWKYETQLRERVTGRDREIEELKKQVVEAESRYTGLDILYKRLHSDFADSEAQRQQQVKTTQEASGRYDSSLTQCFANIQQSYQNGLNAGRQLYACSQSTPVRCTTELVGYSLQTVCR